MTGSRFVALQAFVPIAFLLACAPAATPAAPPAAPASPVGAPAAPPATKPAQSVSLIIGSKEEPGNLNAIADLPHHYPQHVPLTLLYDSLTEVQPDGKIGPKLADAWQVSPDGLTVTFKLTDKARWPDGKPLTADDVKFTFYAMMNPDSKASREGVETIKSVDRLEALGCDSLRIVEITVALRERFPWLLRQRWENSVPFPRRWPVQIPHRVSRSSALCGS